MVTLQHGEFLVGGDPFLIPGQRMGIRDKEDKEKRVSGPWKAPVSSRRTGGAPNSLQFINDDDSSTYR
jgi:hypothetical protein